MRTILLILIIAVVALIAAVQTGMIDIRQTRPAVAPSVERTGGKLTTTPGQAPAFDVETGSIGVGTRDTKVPVPAVEVRRDEKSVALPSVEVRRPAEENQANTAR